MSPRTPYQAKFSLAYCTVAALVEGRVDLAQFSADRFGDDGVREPLIREMLARTRVVVADDLTAKYPGAWPARLTLTLSDGIASRARATIRVGTPRTRSRPRPLEQKFAALVGGRFGDEVARRGARRVARPRIAPTTWPRCFRDFPGSRLPIPDSRTPDMNDINPRAHEHQDYRQAVRDLCGLRQRLLAGCSTSAPSIPKRS